MLQNKEFKVEEDISDNYFSVASKQQLWRYWLFQKDQLDALIDILTQLKEVRNESSNNI